MKKLLIGILASIMLFSFVGVSSAFDYGKYCSWGSSTVVVNGQVVLHTTSYNPGTFTYTAPGVYATSSVTTTKISGYNGVIVRSSSSINVTSTTGR